VKSPLLDSLVAARAWQRRANVGGAGAESTDGADPAEKLFWWAFCYVGLGFIAVAVALFASDVAG
jgi:hypothetical protein